MSLVSLLTNREKNNNNKFVYGVANGLKTSLLHVKILWFFTIFFYKSHFFFLAQLYQRHDLLPRIIQYNTICKYFQTVQNISSFSLVSCNICSLCIGKGSWIWVVCVRRRIRLLIANHSVGKKKFLSKCYSITLQRQKTGWHRQK